MTGFYFAFGICALLCVFAWGSALVRNRAVSSVSTVILAILLIATVVYAVNHPI